MLKSIDTRGMRITPRDDENTLKKYLNEIAGPEYNTLTPDEEVELFYKIKEWDEKAKEKIIKANLRFVVSVAKQYTKWWKLLQELIEEWNIWLIKAVNRFDVTKWFKFITYAVWRIRQSISQYLAKNSTIVRPLNWESIRKKIQKFEIEFQQKNTRLPSKNEIMEGLWLEEKDVISYFEASPLSTLKSLDDTWYTEDSPLVDIIPNHDIKSPDFDLQKSNQRETILKTLKANLKPFEYDIITSYFWIWKDRAKSYEEIWFDMEFSRERIRQIIKRTLSKLSKIFKWTEIDEIYKSLDS